MKTLTVTKEQQEKLRDMIEELFPEYPVKQNVTENNKKLTNLCKFIVCNFVKRELPVGYYVGSYACLNCPNFISSTEEEVTCKGEKIITDIYGRIM